MPYNIPRVEYILHPEGRHTGKISRHEDKGVQKTQWGDRHKIAIWIESETAIQTDDRPFTLMLWFTLSSDERASLRKFRQAVLDRPLTADEIACFDPDKELMGQRFSYRVDHTTGDDGHTWARLREGSIEPIQGYLPMTPRPIHRPPKGTIINPDEPPPDDRDEPPSPDSDDLPF